MTKKTLERPINAYKGAYKRRSINKGKYDSLARKRLIEEQEFTKHDRAAYVGDMVTQLKGAIAFADATGGKAISQWDKYSLQFHTIDLEHANREFDLHVSKKEVTAKTPKDDTTIAHWNKDITYLD